MNGSIPFMRLCKEALGPNVHKCESTLVFFPVQHQDDKKLQKSSLGTKLNKERTLNSFISCVDNPSRTVLAPFLLRSDKTSFKMDSTFLRLLTN